MEFKIIQSKRPRFYKSAKREKLLFNIENNLPLNGIFKNQSSLWSQLTILQKLGLVKKIITGQKRNKWEIVKRPEAL